MSWVRYDDGFAVHTKTIEAVDRDPAAIGLHVLGNCWTATTADPGFIPAAAPTRLIGRKGKACAQILVDAGLWEVGELDGRPGWWVHDYERYNPLSEDAKARRSERARRAANIRWGNDPDAKSHADGMPESMRVASDPHAPPDAESMPADAIARGGPVPKPVPPTTELAIASSSVAPRTLNQRANDLADHYAELVPLCNHQAVASVVRTALRAVEGNRANYTDTQIAAALERLADDNRTVTANTLRHELDGPPINRTPAMATGTQRALAAHEIANRLREAGQ